MEKVHQKDIGVDLGELVTWSQGRLKWRHDWGNIPVGNNAGYWWMPDALERYERERSYGVKDLWEPLPEEPTMETPEPAKDEQPDPYEVQPTDRVIRARVSKFLPNNPRRVWVIAPEIEGKGVCNLPLRMVKRFRDPGKVIHVRHVEGRTYQLVRKTDEN